MPEFTFQLTEDPIDTGAPTWDSRFGAELSFVGVVRGIEKEEGIDGIDYAAYPEMAKRKMATLGREALGKFGEHRASITHRIGFVGAAEPSVVLKIGAPHSPEAFAICRWYLDKLKKEVPIWKKIETCSASQPQ